MTKAKEPKNPGCASSFWKGFSIYEKKMWALFYEDFKTEVPFPSELCGKKNKKQREAIKKQREAMAHNMALQAIWAMRKRNNALGNRNPYEMLLRFAAKIDAYTPEMRRMFNRLAFVLYQEYVVCGELAVKGAKSKVRLYDWESIKPKE